MLLSTWKSTKNLCGALEEIDVHNRDILAQE